MNNQEMTLEEKVLRAYGRMCEFDIRRHLKDGVFVYESFEEFNDELRNSGEDDAEEIKRDWDALEEVNVDGQTYRFDVAL